MQKLSDLDQLLGLALLFAAAYGIQCGLDRFPKLKARAPWASPLTAFVAALFFGIHFGQALSGPSGRWQLVPARDGYDNVMYPAHLFRTDTGETRLIGATHYDTDGNGKVDCWTEYHRKLWPQAPVMAAERNKKPWDDYPEVVSDPSGPSTNFPELDAVDEARAKIK